MRAFGRIIMTMRRLRKKTTEDSRTGRLSYAYNYNEDKKGINLVANSAVLEGNVPFHARMYIKGLTDARLAQLELRVSFYNSEGGRTGEKDLQNMGGDEQGWTEFSYTGTTPADNAKISLRIYYRKADSDALTQTLYFDDLEIMRLPENIAVMDCKVLSSSVMDLGDLRIWEINGGKVVRELLGVKDSAAFSVLSGEAFIDDSQNLVYTGDGSGTVTLRMQYMGLQATFKAAFEPGLKLSKNGSIISVKNNTNLQKEILYIVCMYDDNGMLYICRQNTAQVNAGETVTLDAAIGRTPYFIQNPTKKVFVSLDNQFLEFDRTE